MVNNMWDDLDQLDEIIEKIQFELDEIEIMITNETPGSRLYWLKGQKKALEFALEAINEYKG